MLVERNQVVIGIIAALVIAAGTVFAVIGTAGGFGGGTPLTAMFTDAAALKAGDFVFVAGVRSGRVDSVDIDGDLARVGFHLEAADVPNDSTATILLQNTLGKRAIKIFPGTSDTPFAEGDVIPVERTSTPVDFPELGDETVDLLGETDADALQAVTTALADITEGQRQEVADLLDGIERVTRVVAERKDDLATLIGQAETVVDALADEDQQLVSIVDDFGSTLDRLSRRRADVRRLLRATGNATDLAADLLEERRSQLDRILFELHDDLTIVDRHQVDIANAFAYSGVSVEGFAGVGYMHGDAYDDTPAWGNVFTTDLGRGGVEQLLGCGGDIDQALTQLIGPDPKCEGNEEVPQGASAAAAAPARVGLRTFFTAALHRGGA